MVFLTIPYKVPACCPAFRQGADIRISDQNIIVIWDPVTKVEHFIRQAGFKRPKAQVSSEGEKEQSGFGFLVPSPTKPVVEESEAAVFANLEGAVQPEERKIEEWSVDLVPLILKPFMLSAAKEIRVSPPSAAVDVRVLERKQVAGYDVAILEASDPSALITWLKENGYESRDALKEWAKPYIEKGWLITAFKYSEEADRVDVGAVRMSFKTDRAVFPYRVPLDQRIDTAKGEGNLLRTYIVGPGRADGILGEHEAAMPWNVRSRVRYSRPIPTERWRALLGNSIPSADVDGMKGMWLTAVDDNTWPSGSEDLWFDFDTKGKEYQPVKKVRVARVVPLPSDVIGLAIAGVIWLRLRKRVRA
jgi:hypothetical protein